MEPMGTVRVSDVRLRVIYTRTSIRGQSMRVLVCDSLTQEANLKPPRPTKPRQVIAARLSHPRPGHV